jgi:hypothetical protein
MNKNMDKKTNVVVRYTLQDFLPLIIIFGIIGLITLAHQVYFGWNGMECMRIIMASFFLIFGSFKIINLAGFAQAYHMYDLISQRFYWYGYLYPFLELFLGMAYLFNWKPFEINVFTLLLMLISAAGVFNELRKGKTIVCACLGVLFKIPMTYVTLLEDVIMAGMAAIMLFVL